MTERFDKNGIRILDAPKQANQLKRRPCLPDEHSWDYTHTDSDTVGTHKHFKCRNCNDSMVETNEYLDDLYHF